MTPAIQQAVEEIKLAYSDHPVSVEEEAQGGAYVTVKNLFIGNQYQPERSDCTFLITFQYPYADVYPHFLDAAVVRKDGKPHPQGFGTVNFKERPALQISRRSNHRDPAQETAALKLAKVLQWIEQQ
jgi:hypothetical protein